MKNYGSNHPFSRIYITIDSFGTNVPNNWPDIARAMNGRIDKIIAAENITEDGEYPDYDQLLSISKKTDELWKAMLDGTLSDVPHPVYS